MRVEQLSENVTLINADAVRAMHTLSAIDVVITDPPYGVLDEEWDDMDEKELSRFTMGWLSEARALTPSAVIFFGQRTRHIINPLLYMLYPHVRQIVWNKGGGNIADDGMFYSYESAYFCHPIKTWSVCEPKAMAVADCLRRAREVAGLSKGGVDMIVRGKKTGLCYRWEEACCLPTDEQVALLRPVLSLADDFDIALREAKAARDVVLAAAREQTTRNAARYCDVISVAVPQKKAHPTEKPVPLMSPLVEIASEHGQTVLDPFMGSGSTGVSCVKAGRKFVGIERDPKHFATACRRISDALARPDMFVQRAPEPKQEALL